MGRHSRLFLLIVAAALGCGSDLGPTIAPPAAAVPSPIADVPVKEIVIPSLPSPFYRFEYDATGKVTFVSYASDLRTYDIHYEGNRLSEMQSIRPSPERLTYVYDATGKVSDVTYTDDTGAVYVRIHMTYAGGHLGVLERERLVDGNFQSDKRMSFALYPDSTRQFGKRRFTSQRRVVGWKRIVGRRMVVGSSPPRLSRNRSRG